MSETQTNPENPNTPELIAQTLSDDHLRSWLTVLMANSSSPLAQTAGAPNTDGSLLLVSIKGSTATPGGMFDFGPDSKDGTQYYQYGFNAFREKTPNPSLTVQPPEPGKILLPHTRQKLPNGTEFITLYKNVSPAIGDPPIYESVTSYGKVPVSPDTAPKGYQGLTAIDLFDQVCHLYKQWVGNPQI